MPAITVRLRVAYFDRFVVNEDLNYEDVIGELHNDELDFYSGEFLLVRNGIEKRREVFKKNRCTKNSYQHIY